MEYLLEKERSRAECELASPDSGISSSSGEIPTIVMKFEQIGKEMGRPIVEVIDDDEFSERKLLNPTIGERGEDTRPSWCCLSLSRLYLQITPSIRPVVFAVTMMALSTIILAR